MLRKLSPYAIAFMISLSIAANAFAQVSLQAHPVRCEPRKDIAQRLAGYHKEIVVAIGIDKFGQLLEMWMHLKRGTFTVTRTDPATNRACIIMAGKHAYISMPAQKRQGVSFEF